jgi:hypothetical protein
VWEYGGRNGKAAKPRCFKNLTINNLPVIWRNNKRAWRTAATMEEWVNMFNAKMKRKIALKRISDAVFDFECRSR